MQFKNPRQFCPIKGVITSHHPPDNIHLNILVPPDKLDVIMHPPGPCRQKTIVAHPLRIISGTALIIRCRNHHVSVSGCRCLYRYYYYYYYYYYSSTAIDTDYINIIYTLRCTSSADRTSTSSQHLRSAGICCRWSDDV